jgi:uncharacterized protein
VLVYLDTSTILPLLVDDAHTPIMQDWLVGVSVSVTLSDFAAAEFAAAISRGLRIGRFRARAADTALAQFDQWRLERQQRRTSSEDIVACERLVRDFRLKLNAPDALHLAIARADDVPLVTFDQRLAAAARAVNHRVIVPGE